MLYMKKRTIWAIGTALALCACFFLYRFAFFGLRGLYQYPAFLLFIGLVAIGIAVVFGARKVMICSVIGCIGGFGAGVAFGVDRADPGGGTTNNWWVIWTVSFIVMLLIGVIWEVISRHIKRRTYVDYIVTIHSPTKGDMRVRVEQRDFDTINYTLLDGISAGYGFGTKIHNSRGGIASLSQEYFYNEAKEFIEQLGPSGYLDDGP